VIAATWPLLLGMGVLMLGAGLQSTLLGLRATAEGFPPQVTGIIMSGYYVGYLAGTAAAPRLLRQVGHIRVFAALAAVASATILVQAAFVEPVVWVAMRLTSGVCFAGIYVVAESWLNDRATPAHRGRLLSVYMLVLYVGLGAAQFLILPANPNTTTPFMLVSVLISLSMVPIVVSAQQAPEPLVPRKVRYRDLYQLAARGGRGVGFRDDLGGRLLDGPGIRALERTGQWGYRQLHGGEYSCRGVDPVSGGPAVGSHGPSDRDRCRVHHRDPGRRQHCWVPGDAACFVPAFRGAFQWLGPDALLASRLARQR